MTTQTGGQERLQMPGVAAGEGVAGQTQRAAVRGLLAGRDVTPEYTRTGGPKIHRKGSPVT